MRPNVSYVATRCGHLSSSGESAVLLQLSNALARDTECAADRVEGEASLGSAFDRRSKRLASFPVRRAPRVERADRGV